MTDGTGEAPPRTGWAPMVPELFVSDLPASLDFWLGLLGFRIAYSRDRVVVMVAEHIGERPLGQG